MYFDQVYRKFGVTLNLLVIESDKSSRENLYNSKQRDLSAKFMVLVP